MRSHQITIAVLIAASASIGSAGFNVPCDSTGPAGTPFVRGTNCRTVTVDGLPREYIVYVAKSSLFQFSLPAPVVIHFHGTGGNASGTFGENGWSQKAESTGLVAVMGSGAPYYELNSNELTTKWNVYTLGVEVDLTRRPPFYPTSALFPADDVKFTDTMLNDVRAGLTVDPNRIYISGFSNGGGMVLRLGIERSEVFASAGSAGSGILPATYSSTRPMPLFSTMGSKDGHFLDGINSAADKPAAPLREAPLNYTQLFAFSAVRVRYDRLTASYGMSNVPTELIETPTELRVVYKTPLPGNTAGNEVILSIQGGVAHEYPRAGNNPNGFDATNLFWDYFKEHPRTASTPPARRRAVRR